MPITPITPSGSNAPNDLPSDAAGAVAVPNTLPSDAAGAVAVPNTLPADGAGSVASPVSLPSVAAAAAPRTLTPMVNLDFAAKSYARKGRTVLFDDIFTYTRPSSATFINRRPDVDGGYEYFLDTDYVGSVTNLALYSEDFSNAAWVKSNTSITTSFITSPHGATTVSKLIENSALGVHVSSQTTVPVSAGNYNFSVYMKKAERRYGSIRAVSDSFGKRFGAVIDLDTGIITSTSNFGGAIVSNLKIKPLDNGWFNISVTLTHGAGNIDIAACSSDLPVPTFFGAAPEYTGDGVSGVYIWGAQVTESAKPLPYVKTLSSAVTKTFTETLRVEYDAATGKNLGALIEGASTNLVLRSEQIGGASWFGSQISFNLNSITAPDGTMTASKFINSALNSEHYLDCQNINPTDGTFTSSVYVKKGSTDTFVLKVIHIGLNPVVSRAVYNFSTDSFSDLFGVIDFTKSTKLSNGWVRLQATYILDATVTEHRMRLQSTMVTNSPNQTVYAWGAQIEELPFATSYIRTDASAVSRSKDRLSLPASTLLKNLPITVNAKFDTYQGTTPATQRHLFRDDGTVPRIRAYIGISGSSITTSAGSDAVSFGVTDSLFNGELTIVGTDSTLATYTDKTLVQSKANTTPWRSDLTGETYIGSSGGHATLFGHISKFSTYAQALTAQEITLL